MQQLKNRNQLLHLQQLKNRNQLSQMRQLKNGLVRTANFIQFLGGLIDMTRRRGITPIKTITIPFPPHIMELMEKVEIVEVVRRRGTSKGTVKVKVLRRRKVPKGKGKR
jgi:hypothetical protein